MKLDKLSFVLAALLATESVPAAAPEPAASSFVPWPVGKSAPPTHQAWLNAEAVSFTRVSGGRASHCTAQRVREWLEVRCPELHTSAITQLGGGGSPAFSSIVPAGDDRIPGGGEAVFPLRKGDRRVLLWWTLGEGYDGPLTVVPGIVLQEYWLAEQPILVLTDALHEPVPTAKTGK
jgi:hypothetical protein